MTDEHGEAQFDSALQRRVVRSAVWVAIGYGGGQAVSFASTLVLVRLLDPGAFGIVAIGLALVAVLGHIHESGIGAALVNRREEIREVASSALVFSAFSGIALAGAIALIAPVYADVLRAPEATPYIRALALMLAIRGLTVVPGAILERNIDFKSQTKAELSSYVTQAVVAVAAAFAGAGAWSLVAGQLAGQLVLLTLLWALAPWRPSPADASLSTLRELVRYGRHVSGANILGVVNAQLPYALVARSAGTGGVGVFSIASRLAQTPNSVVGVVVGRVMFSVYSRLQRDLAAVRAAYLENLQRTVLFGLPLNAGLAIATEPAVLGLLGSRWEAAIEPLRLLAVVNFVGLVTAPSGEVFRGIGRPGLGFLGQAIYLPVSALALLLLVPRWGTSGAAAALLIAATVTGSIALILTFRLLHLELRVFAGALARPFACTLAPTIGLLVALPATDSLAPLPALGVLVGIAVILYAVSLLTIGRSLVLVIVRALRRA